MGFDAIDTESVPISIYMINYFRYMLKLFRDYMFHQVMEDGRPFLDMAHVITNLNRLDAGIPDKVILRTSHIKALVHYLCSRCA